MLDRKLDLILKMLAFDKLQGKTHAEQVRILTGVGLRPTEISAITGIDIRIVTARQAEARKAKAPGGERSE